MATLTTLWARDGDNLKIATTNMATATATPKLREPLKRVASADFATAEEFLKAAAYIVLPEDQTQRQAFAKLMPHLFVLRNKGCSFKQLASLLTECGLNLQPSTVRSYFDEMLADRMDVCKAQMKMQIEILAEVRKETQGIDMTAIAGLVDQTMAKRREDASAKINQRFNTVARAPVPPQAPELRQDPPSVAVPPTVKPKAPEQAPRPIPKAVTPPVVHQDGAPTIPNITPRTSPAKIEGAAQMASAPATAPTRLTCAPLKDGIPPIKKRDNVPSKVYEPGELEHPAIPNLFLSLDQRRYGASLELIDPEDGTIRLETMEEKRFRYIWRTPVAPTQTRTGEDFTKMDITLFKNP